MAKGTLKVTIVSAKGLRNKDDVGKSDPYVKVWVNAGDQKFTTTKVGTLDPVWNEDFVFQIDGQDQLHFELFDSDAPRDQHKDDWLGKGHVDLKNVFEKHQVQETRELRHNLGLSKDGVITVKLEFTHAK